MKETSKQYTDRKISEAMGEKRSADWFEEAYAHEKMKHNGYREAMKDMIEILVKKE